MQIQKLQTSFLETMFAEEKIEFRALEQVYCKNPWHIPEACSNDKKTIRGQ